MFAKHVCYKRSLIVSTISTY